MKAVLLAAVVLAAGARDLWAHDEGSSSSEIRVSGSEVVWAVDVGTLGLARVMDLGAPPHRLTEESLAPFRERIARFVAGGLRLRINGRPAAAEAGPMEPIFEEIPPTDVRVLSRIRQVFRFSAGEEIRRIDLTFGLFSQFVSNHRAVLTVAWGGRTREFVLSGRGSLAIRPETLDAGGWSAVPSFVGWGVHHIFIGFDHIAFLLALLLVARGASDILKIVTSFTVAHSLTLLLAALDVLRIPGRLTEALIALSIVYVAAENFLVKEARHRWMLAFAFGLVHGLGFSGQLRDLLTDRIVVPVLAFNLGIELGQLAILAVAYPILRFFQGSPGPSGFDLRRRRLAWAGSAPLFLFGMGWLIERISGFQFMPL